MLRITLNASRYVPKVAKLGFKRSNTISYPSALVQFYSSDSSNATDDKEIKSKTSNILKNNKPETDVLKENSNKTKKTEEIKQSTLLTDEAAEEVNVEKSSSTMLDKDAKSLNVSSDEEDSEDEITSEDEEDSDEYEEEDSDEYEEEDSDEYEEDDSDEYEEEYDDEDEMYTDDEGSELMESAGSDGSEISDEMEAPSRRRSKTKRFDFARPNDDKPKVEEFEPPAYWNEDYPQDFDDEMKHELEKLQIFSDFTSLIDLSWKDEIHPLFDGSDLEMELNCPLEDFNERLYIDDKNTYDTKVIMHVPIHCFSGLDEAGRKYVQQLAGVRYNPKKKVLKLTEDRYNTRRHNHKRLCDILHDLTETAHELSLKEKSTENSSVSV